MNFSRDRNGTGVIVESINHFREQHGTNCGPHLVSKQIFIKQKAIDLLLRYKLMYTEAVIKCEQLNLGDAGRDLELSMCVQEVRLGRIRCRAGSVCRFLHGCLLLARTARMCSVAHRCPDAGNTRCHIVL